MARVSQSSWLKQVVFNLYHAFHAPYASRYIINLFPTEATGLRNLCTHRGCYSLLNITVKKEGQNPNISGQVLGSWGGDNKTNKTRFCQNVSMETN